VRGKVVGEAVGPGVVYAVDLPASSAPEGQPHALLRQRNLKFNPLVLPVLVGTQVDFANQDETPHNVFSPTAAEAFDLGSFSSGVRTHQFRAPGVHVILCNVHLEMVAWVLVLATPAFSVLEADGSFTLQLPPGRHRLALFRPRQPELSREVDVPEQGALELTWSLSEQPQ
jgi:plastocyanin